MVTARFRKRKSIALPTDPDAWWEKEENVVSRIYQLVGALRVECRDNPNAAKLTEALSDSLWEADLWD